MHHKIIYIAGAGRSGSTMLDAVIGNFDDYFSCGELQNFTINGLERGEYCACGKPVPECEIWSKVNFLWEAKRKLSLEHYNRILQKYFFSYRRIHILIFNYFFPSVEYKNFTTDTKFLYESIFDVIGTKTIVDSSKNPLRLLFLRKMGFELVILHLSRNLIGVINSKKKRIEKNIRAGVEKDIKPQKTNRIAVNWCCTNLLAAMFSLKKKRVKVRYESLINDPREIVTKLLFPDKISSELLNARGPFYTKHIVAGNKMRMRKSFHISSVREEMESKNLTKWDKKLGAVLNSLF